MGTKGKEMSALTLYQLVALMLLVIGLYASSAAGRWSAC